MSETTSNTPARHPEHDEHGTGGGGSATPTGDSATPTGDSATSTGGSATPTGGSAHYRAPGWFTRNVFNGFIAAATRTGLSVWGSRVLEVPGRQSGEPRRTPVNLLTFEGRQYLVAPRGETQWVRNVRANGGELALLVGRRRSEWHAEEVPDGDKVPVLRAYLKRWKAEVGVFFDGIGPDSPEADVQRIAAARPVFRLTAR